MILGIIIGSIVIFAACSLAILRKFKSAVSRKPVTLVRENEGDTVDSFTIVFWSYLWNIWFSIICNSDFTRFSLIIRCSTKEAF